MVTKIIIFCIHQVMGQRHGKTGVTSIPTNPACFPLLPDKDLILISSTAASSVSRLRQILQLATGLVFDAAQMSTTTFCLTAVSTLVSFTLDHLNSSQESCVTMTSGDTVATSSSLEESLLAAKIDKVVVSGGILALRAKLTAIQNRYERLLEPNSSLDWADRRLEVIPALVLCEEILALFEDEEYIFARHPLSATPFLVTFGGVYVAVAEFSLAILPSYRTGLVKQMLLLGKVLASYKVTCVKMRMKEVVLRKAIRVGPPDTWMDGVCDAIEVEDVVQEFYLHDPLLHRKKSQNNNDVEESSHFEEEDKVHFQSVDEVLSIYRGRLEEKYDTFFAGILQNVADFSGFRDQESE